MRRVSSLALCFAAFALLAPFQAKSQVRLFGLESRPMGNAGLLLTAELRTGKQIAGPITVQVSEESGAPPKATPPARNVIAAQTISIAPNAVRRAVIPVKWRPGDAQLRTLDVSVCAGTQCDSRQFKVRRCAILHNMDELHARGAPPTNACPKDRVSVPPTVSKGKGS